MVSQFYLAEFFQSIRWFWNEPVNKLPPAMKHVAWAFSGLQTHSARYRHKQFGLDFSFHKMLAIASPQQPSKLSLSNYLCCQVQCFPASCTCSAHSFESRKSSLTSVCPAPLSLPSSTERQLLPCNVWWGWLRDSYLGMLDWWCPCAQSKKDTKAVTWTSYFWQSLKCRSRFNTITPTTWIAWSSGPFQSTVRPTKPPGDSPA